MTTPAETRARVLTLSKNPNLGLGVVRCLGTAGHRVYSMGVGRWSVVRASRHCRQYVALDDGALSESASETASRVEDFCRTEGIQVIVPVDLDAGLFAAQFRGRFRSARLIPLAPVEVIREVNDKWQFAKFLQSASLAHPKTVLLDDFARPPEVDWSRPHMIKPTLGGHSEGVKRLDRPGDLEAYARTEGANLAPPFLLQEYVPGQDIDVSVLAIDGKVVARTTQMLGDEDEVRIFVTSDPAQALGQAVVERLRYSGLLHLDMRLEEGTGKVYIIEGNPRFWVTLPWSMWAGVNFADLAVQAALGHLGESSPVAREGPYGRSSLWPSRAIRELWSDLVAGGDHPYRASRGTVYTDPLPQVVHALGRLQRHLFTGRAL